MCPNLHPLQQTRPYQLASLWQGRSTKTRHSKKSKGKSQVASCTEAVALAQPHHHLTPNRPQLAEANTP
jgi:hypothetical protein